MVLLEGFASVVTLGMAKYRKLSQCIYCCKYHIVWTPNYRFRIMRDALADILTVNGQFKRKNKTICAWKEVEMWIEFDPLS